MANDERSEDSEGRRSGDQERDIARRRDELLANARAAAEGKPTPSAAGSGLMALGVQFVVAILLCLYAGMWLDRKLGTAPWLMLAGVIAGATSSFYVMYRALTAEDRKNGRARRK